MNTKSDMKEKLLQDKAFLEALINRNHMYYSDTKINGLEFSKYIRKIQMAYQEKITEEEIKLYTIIGARCILTSRNKLIKDLKQEGEYFLRIAKIPDIIPLSDRKKLKKFINTYGYDAYYKLMVASRRLDEYLNQNSLVIPKRIIRPKNPNVSLAITDDSLTIIENIDREMLKYTNTLEYEDYSVLKDGTSSPLFIDNGNIFDLYLKSICLDDKVLPKKAVEDIKALRLKKL